ncbi:hypothetical protein BDA96_07G047000 [Sorghum bicolor]|uniref:Uncharacterized protein n=2 Tax=Sorghum bicolor TaxID=4558 RepID=A0A921U9F9_SORBI|nr:hypothetical protein BDA96_07G047000 [Sorghum bicolor]OQU79912.1 hypothetical protein SORBI_3007G044201 [Sorghum bicolor]
MGIESAVYPAVIELLTARRRVGGRRPIRHRQASSVAVRRAPVPSNAKASFIPIRYPSRRQLIEMPCAIDDRDAGDRMLHAVPMCRGCRRETQPWWRAAGAHRRPASCPPAHRILLHLHAMLSRSKEAFWEAPVLPC